MDSDPILTYAPRRHDGRLGMHQWPAGEPVAYDPYDKPGEGDLCGDCASPFDEKGAEFRAWGVATSRFYFRCGGCKQAIVRARTDRFSFPIPGFARAEGQEGQIRVQLLDGRLSRTPPDSNAAKCYRFLAPCHLIYPYFASLTQEGIGPSHPAFEEAMESMDLHSGLRIQIDGALADARSGDVDGAVKLLRWVRRLQPRHLETTARIAQLLEATERKAEAAWEWEGLGEAFREAGFLEAGKEAREGRVLF